MKNDLISVIIPVYNVEKYLARCIKSVLNQTYEHLEIILVNDGSLDNSGLICDDFASKSDKIKVFHKKNGGVSSARNMGLKNISDESKYICFIDSDDYIPKDSIENLYNGLTEQNTDICCEAIEKKLISFQKDPQSLLKYISMGGSYSPYAKLFKTSIIKDNDIFYNTSLKCSEDALFIRQYLKYCNSLCLIPQRVYYRNMQTENSLSKQGHRDYSLYYAKKMDALTQLVSTLPLSNQEKASFISQRAVHGIKISFFHYYNYFKNDDLMHLFQTTYNNIAPYITTLKLNCLELEKWCRYIGLSSKKVDIRKIFLKTIFLFKITPFLHKLKRLIKKPH